MIELLALWEKGWLDQKVEAFMWRQLAAAFQVDRLIFCPPKLGQQRPEEYPSIPDALASSSCTPIFLIPGMGESLLSYSHPVDAAYVFGNAQDNNLRWATETADIVRIPTPAPVDFFGIDAAAIVLYDRMKKGVDNGN